MTIVRSCGLVLLFVLLVFGQPTAANASIISVNTIDDEINADGDCSLREAIQAANNDVAVDACSAGSGTDTVSIPAGTYAISIFGPGENEGNTGDLDVTESLAIVGSGSAATVMQAVGGTEGFGADRVVDIVGGSVSILDVTISGGRAVTEPIPGCACGGGIRVLAGASLSVSESIISNNRTDGDDGGGIYNRGTLSLSNVTLNGNLGKEGGGLANVVADAVLSDVIISNNRGETGGGIGNSYSNLNVTNTSIVENRGGGIANFAGTVELDDVTISSNHADGAGGGVANRVGNMAITGSEITANSASFDAGGIANFPAFTFTTRPQLTLSGVTVSGNAAGRDGGGIYNLVGDAVLQNVTISGNEAATGAEPGTGDGLLNSATAAMTIASATIVGNPASGAAGVNNSSDSMITMRDTVLAGAPLADNCSGVITSQGHNLDSGTGCGLTGAGDIVATDPLLGPLADNGGPTRTHALLEGSPAIDAGSPECPPPAIDQRGVARPQGPACDIGAFEAGELTPTPTPTHRSTPTPTPTATPTSTATPTATPTSTPTGTATATATPTSTPTGPTPTSTPTGLSCDGLPATIVGTAGDDAIAGTSASDVIAAGDGDDVIRGHGGNDTICGGPGDDVLRGGPGNDRLDGGSGQDRCAGAAGVDVLVDCERSRGVP